METERIELSAKERQRLKSFPCWQMFFARVEVLQPLSRDCLMRLLSAFVFRPHHFRRHFCYEAPRRDPFRLNHQPILAARDDAGFAGGHAFEANPCHFFGGFRAPKHTVGLLGDSLKLGIC